MIATNIPVSERVKMYNAIAIQIYGSDLTSLNNERMQTVVNTALVVMDLEVNFDI